MHFHAPSDLRVELVSATRMSEDDFWTKSALGQSLAATGHEGRLVTRISYENTRGLPLVYNDSIDSGDPHDILVFLHDDIWLQDLFFVERILSALQDYDIAGLAGNTRRVPWQFAWYRDLQDEFDWGHMSGVVGHGPMPFTGEMTTFGPTPQACELLDGLFLAVRKSVLRESGLRFDPRFDFHFYDLDFSRQARAKGLRLGTFPMSVTHQSGGNAGTEGWYRMRDAYWAKWGD